MAGAHAAERRAETAGVTPMEVHGPRLRRARAPRRDGDDHPPRRLGARSELPLPAGAFDEQRLHAALGAGAGAAGLPAETERQHSLQHQAQRRSVSIGAPGGLVAAGLRRSREAARPRLWSRAPHATSSFRSLSLRRGSPSPARASAPCIRLDRPPRRGRRSPIPSRRASSCTSPSPRRACAPRSRTPCRAPGRERSRCSAPTATTRWERGPLEVEFAQGRVVLDHQGAGARRAAAREARGAARPPRRGRADRERRVRGEASVGRRRSDFAGHAPARWPTSSPASTARSAMPSPAS